MGAVLTTLDPTGNLLKTQENKGKPAKAAMNRHGHNT